ncbi:branched-chain amino acid ABC transporter permease [Pseudorhodoferax aquiterrae]|uniref:Branched-chain amino acid ABC transporter permease n=1 Tax=Pseudorhodoferax aquiterrae TaxID=747304 RepID=A0ABQ3G8I4_9BURK|nr:AzlC family ABC transporter permease [Pseudorhodoferax aquiterrae]GHC96655.1 branched-chain amino acid ABC transporter permease [Pseudorhodoferax aquiterrae]
MQAGRSTASSGGWRAGFAVGAGFGVGAFALAVGFGAAAVAQGWPAWLATLMSAIVFAGGAQFALVMAFASGGMPAALGAATLINLRFIPMALTSEFKGGAWRRSLEAQAVVDASWAAARRPDGGVDRAKMLGATLVQWPAWVAGTAMGAYLAPEPALARAIGLDLVFPGFFLVFVLDIVRGEPRRRGTVALAVLVTAGMCWLLPPGVALMFASVAALPALLRRGAAA